MAKLGGLITHKETMQFIGTSMCATDGNGECTSEGASRQAPESAFSASSGLTMTSDGDSCTATQEPIRSALSWHCAKDTASLVSDGSTLVNGVLYLDGYCYRKSLQLGTPIYTDFLF